MGWSWPSRPPLLGLISDLISGGFIAVYYCISSMRCIAFQSLQSFSRFVARRAGLAGRNDMELARADMVALHSYYDFFYFVGIFFFSRHPFPSWLVCTYGLWLEAPESHTHLQHYMELATMRTSAWYKTNNVLCMIWQNLYSSVCGCFHDGSTNIWPETYKKNFEVTCHYEELWAKLGPINVLSCVDKAAALVWILSWR